MQILLKGIRNTMDEEMIMNSSHGSKLSLHILQLVYTI